MSPKSICLLAPLLAFAGCAALFGSTQKTPQEKNLTVRYTVPSIKTMEGTQEAQEKNGVMIAVSTSPFTPQKVFRKEYKQLPTTFVMNGQYDYEVTSVPAYTVAPDDLRFKVKVVNNLSQVLRLAGTLVRFNVDGKELTLDTNNASMKALTDTVLAPREQKEFDLVGPKAATVPKDTTVSLQLYGVVTATDDAGNATKRSNFEWLYKVGKDDVVRDETYTVENQKLRPSEVPSE